MSYREIEQQAKNRDEKETPNSIPKKNWPPRILISVSTLRKGKQLWATKWVFSVSFRDKTRNRERGFVLGYGNMSVLFYFIFLLSNECIYIN